MDLNLESSSKKRNCKPEQDNQRNGIDSLPKDVAFDIISRLDITSVIKSRFVCRSWCNLTLDQNLASLHLSQVAKRNPMFIFHSDYPIRNELYFAEFSGTIDDADGRGIVKKLSTPFSASMPEFIVVGSCNGLLCVSDSLYKDDMYIYNPFTRDYKALPKTRRYEEEAVVCGFGYHAGIKEYKVVKIVHHWILNFADQYVRRFRMPGTSKSEAFVFTLGGNTWRNVGQVPYYFERRSSEALYTNGRVHWVTRGLHNNIRGLIIISFDLAEEKFIEIPRPDFSVADGRNYHLAIMRRCLSAVIVRYGFHRDIEIWVMKKYNVKESWIKEFNFRGYVPQPPFRKLLRPVRIWRNNISRGKLRVLCILENGQILIEYKTGRLVVYDLGTRTYKDITLKGMPTMFQTVVHMGSLNRIDLPIHM